MSEEQETVTLFRPTGPDELKLVEESGFKRWPPRLPGQPIFYPVIQTVGASHPTEWWVPDGELEELNDNIVGKIEVIGEYHAS